MAGALFETHAVSECLARVRTLVEPANLFFWRSTDGHEVDLIVETAGKTTALEIKWTSTLKPGHRKGLEKWREISGTPANRPAYLVSGAAWTGELGKNVRAVHWAAL